MNVVTANCYLMDRFNFITVILRRILKRIKRLNSFSLLFWRNQVWLLARSTLRQSMSQIFYNFNMNLIFCIYNKVNSVLLSSVILIHILRINSSNNDYLTPQPFSLKMIYKRHYIRKPSLHLLKTTVFSFIVAA